MLADPLGDLRIATYCTAPVLKGADHGQVNLALGSLM